MCGILGIVGNPVNKELFIDALDLQKHRGPDDAGYFQDGSVQFGHRRLSIIDIDHHASQPMIAGNGHLVGIFNGEIYNYQEIRTKLEDKGYVFRTQGDTEVLLNGFDYFGEAILDHLIGMFSFAILDRRRNRIFLARDRLGIKPLFYSTVGNSFIFSSEIKSILMIDTKERGLNETAVSSFLSFRYPILNDSFYKGIKQVPPGYILEVDLQGRFKLKPYWSLSSYIVGKQNREDEEFYISRLRELLKSSIKYRMISDVPIGAYLSGGVDSSAVVAHMAMESETPIKTFTIGFEEEGFNEFDYASEVADLYKTDHYEITLGKDDYLAAMYDLIGYKDAPLGVPNEVPLFLMSKELKKHITVVLSGEGADEIFGGYGKIFRSADDYIKLINCNFSESHGSSELCIKLAKKYKNMRFDNEVDHFLHHYRYTGLAEKQQILHERFEKNCIDSILDEKFRDLFIEAGGLSYTEKMMFVFEKIHLPGLLQRVDVTTMAASVEARVPFVDHRLVEFAFSIPAEYKLKWKENSKKNVNLLADEISEIYDTPKYILKKSLEKLLPENILYRRKMGFPVPLDRWFGGDFKGFAADQILDGELIRRDIIRKEYVKDLLKSDRMEKNVSIAKTVWMLVSLEMFLKQF